MMPILRGGSMKVQQAQDENIPTQRADGWFFRNVNIHFMAMLLL